MTRRKPIEYKVEIELEGYPAYVINKLVKTGLYGNNREEVVKNLVLSKLRGDLSKNGLLRIVDEVLESAQKKGYMPVEIKDEEEK